MLGPCLGHLCWNDLKMPIFPSRAPSWSPKPRKNRCFWTLSRWSPLPPKDPKHRKETMFFNTASKIHRKLHGLQWFGSGSGVNGGGSAAGPAAPIAFGYHRRPPARTRAPWPAPGLVVVLLLIRVLCHFSLSLFVLLPYLECPYSLLWNVYEILCFSFQLHFFFPFHVLFHCILCWLLSLLIW